MKAIVTYDDEGMGGGIDIIERDSYEEILKVVIRRHSMESTRATTEKGLIKHLKKFNGDGTDFVYSIVVDGVLRFHGTTPEFF